MIELDENAQGVTPEVAKTLAVISAAMAMGLTLMVGLVVWTYVNGAARSPSPDQARMINLLTTIAMVLAAGAIVVSQVAWRRLLRTSPGDLGRRVQAAYIVRLALREGAGFLGMTVAYLAALNGVLKTYPAYWVNLAPYGLFLCFLAAHWPTPEKLTADALESLRS